MTMTITLAMALARNCSIAVPYNFSSHRMALRAITPNCATIIRLTQKHVSVSDDSYSVKRPVKLSELKRYVRWNEQFEKVSGAKRLIRKIRSAFDARRWKRGKRC